MSLKVEIESSDLARELENDEREFADLLDEIYCRISDHDLKSWAERVSGELTDGGAEIVSAIHEAFNRLD